MQRAGHVSTAHESGDIGTIARDISGLSRRHHRFLKGAIGPSAKAEQDLRASTSSKVEVEAHEVQTTPATSRLPWSRRLGGIHRHGPREGQKRRDVADPDVVE